MELDEIIPERDCLFGRNRFVKAYLSTANKWSIRNERMNTLGMFVILSQCIRDREYEYGAMGLDLRIHGMCFQGSGSGKDPLINFMMEICKRIGLKMISMSTITSAGLIGTVTPDGEPVVGPAAYADIIAFKESSNIMHTANTTHSSDLLNLFNAILDKNGHVEKQLAHGTLSYDSHVSFMGTSYPSNIQINMLRTGFLPRMLITYKEIDEDFYEQVSNEFAMSLVTRRTEKDKQIFDKICNTLYVIKNSGSSIILSDKVKGHMLFYSKKIHEKMRSYTVTLNDDLNPFRIRMVSDLMKIAICLAALDDPEKIFVKARNIKDAYEYINEYMNYTYEFVSKHCNKINKQNEDIVTVAKMLIKLSGGRTTVPVTSGQLTNNIWKNLSISAKKSTIESAIKQLSAPGYIIVEEYEERGRKFHRYYITNDLIRLSKGW